MVSHSYFTLFWYSEIVFENFEGDLTHLFVHTPESFVSYYYALSKIFPSTIYHIEDFQNI